MKRLLLSIFFLTIALLALVAPPTHAQGGPPDIIDDIFKELSAKLKKPLDRTTTDWSYSEEAFPSSSLGCPKPDRPDTPGQVKGWDIQITADYVIYDYRVSEKDNSYFLCSTKVLATPTFTATINRSTLTPSFTYTPSRTFTATATPTATFTPTFTATPLVVNLDKTKSVIGYVDSSGDVYVTSIGGTTEIPLTHDGEGKFSIDSVLNDPFNAQTRAYGNLRWSPDGTKLLFTEFKTRSLYLAISRQAPIVLVNDFGLDRSAAPAGAWSPDGKRIAYLARGDNDNTAKLMTISVDNGQVTKLSDVASCPPPSSVNRADLAQIAYEREVGAAGNDLPTRLEWATTRDVLYNSATCHDLIAVTDQGIHWTLHDIAKLALSPDGARAAAVTTATPSQVILIDLKSGHAGAIQGAPSDVDQLGWAADGQNLVLVERTPVKTVAGDPQSALGQQFFAQSWPIQAQVYTLTFSRIAASGGQAVPFLTWQGYRIASITPLRDNSGIVVSLITSADDMVYWLNRNDPTVFAIQQMPHSEILSIPFNKSVPQRIAFAGQLSLSGGGFMAQAAPGTQTRQVNNQQCPGAPPSRLVNGQPAAVTPGDANALKNKAGGDNIGSIPGGARLTVIDGPACTPNGIAWWKVNYKTFTGWTAEGQGTTYYLEP